MALSEQPSTSSRRRRSSATSTKKSAGPPMLKDVCLASGWSQITPETAASQAWLLCVRQLMSKPPDVAGAHEENKVCGLHQLFQLPPSGLEVRRKPGARHAVGQVPAAQAARVLLPRSVDLRHQDFVGTLAGTGEVVEQRCQPAVPVWLEDQHQPAVRQLTRSLQ